jgi:hypothetical protein
MCKAGTIYVEWNVCTKVGGCELITNLDLPSRISWEMHAYRHCTMSVFAQESRNRIMNSYLPIIRISVRASIRRCACLTACIIQATALSISRYSRICGKSKDEVRCMFGSDDNERGRICRRHAGENTGVDDEHVVCAVDLGVEIHN